MKNSTWTAQRGFARLTMGYSRWIIRGQKTLEDGAVASVEGMSYGRSAEHAISNFVGCQVRNNERFADWRPEDLTAEEERIS